MARKPLGIGERGQVSITPQVQVAGRWVRSPNPRVVHRHRARVWFRGWDGVMRDTSAVAVTAGDALKAVGAQADALLRNNGSETIITGSTTILVAGRLWLEQAARSDSGLSAKSISDYTGAFNRNVTATDSPIRGLTLNEVNDPQRLRLFLQGVADRRGTQAAKMMRSVLSRILGYAVDNGVLTSNAMRQLGRVKSQKPRPDDGRDRKRAFTIEELKIVLAHADYLADQPSLNPRTKRKWETAADLGAYMAGTGVRIEEARSTRWEHLDLVSGVIQVPGTKSASSRRSLSLPKWLLERLLERAEHTDRMGLVFSSPAHLDDPERPWDQSNSAQAMRVILDGAGMSWAVPHTFRKTVATRLHQAGVPAARISDQLGHADPGFTLRTYVGRDPDGDKSDLAAML